METEEDYRQNLKRQNVTDTLPAVVTDIRLLPSFYRMMIQDGRLEEVSSDIKNDEEWSEMIEPVVMEACSEPDGRMYLVPFSTAAFSCSGVFWNEELFAQAGITSFPKTWEEFWECCDTLKEHGIIPLALHTEGTAWAPMLFATAEVAETEAGLNFMKELYPDSYQNTEGIRIAQTLERLFSYTTEDALYADFDTAYSNFFSGKAAMVPNGYWMIAQIPEEYETKVRFSAFPGNKLISSPETFGWAVVEDYSEEIKGGALEFLKFRTQKNQEEKEKLFSGDRNRLLPVEKDYLEAYEGEPEIVPNYQVKWNSILQEKTLGEELPKLAQGKRVSSGDSYLYIYVCMVRYTDKICIYNRIIPSLCVFHGCTISDGYVYTVTGGRQNRIKYSLGNYNYLFGIRCRASCFHVLWFCKIDSIRD